MKPVQVVGIGHPVINLGIAIDRLPETNLPARRLGMTWQVGGKIATAMSCIARLGFSSAIAGRAASDVIQYVRRDLAVDGVNTDYLLEQSSADAYFTVCLAERATGNRSFLSAPQPVQDLRTDELPRKLIENAEFLYLWNSTEADFAAARLCKAAGRQLVFDADTFSPEIESLLPLTDHFIASEYYYEALFGKSENYEINLKEIWKRQGGGKVVIVTLGSRGLAGVDESGLFFTQKTFAVNVKDSTGAGDVFHGAYTAGRLAGMDTRAAARFGCAVSAIKCTQLGCRTGLPTMGNALAFMDGKPLNEAELNERARLWARLPF